MLIIPVNELVEGDLLGRGLYAADGRLMLKQGVTLNGSLIDGIRRLGYRYIFVEMTEHRTSISGTDIKRNLMNMTKDVLQQVFRSIQDNNNFPIRPLLEWTDHITTTVEDEKEMTISCHDLAPGGMELLTHSLNVCFLSILTAKALGYNKKQLEQVALGSLLHDIGLVLPHDDTLLVHHPVVGYDILRKHRGISDVSLRIVLQHHEQVDGRGFPNGFKGDQLIEASQICGLASDFDYFMNDPTKDRLPSEGIDFVMSKIDSSYTYAVARGFMQAFQPYPLDTQVVLSGGLTGKVCAINKANYCRPVIQLDQSDTRIDLMKHMTFKIEKVVQVK
ncbi:HD-GYP domain-containing protein [Cohnella silvisoli]|uniref:HD domain-containing protein n=1 Tax=Cohnella silvisoli TaxID=2873699 RepID=A0ABV1KTT5_9BACL|nr:HD domain-containing phosphohydrolase [Cohnella silvisoli]MCD9022743.1 HD domain-containing protein [Cohnella silvisoli]